MLTVKKMSGTPTFAQIFVDHRVSIIPPLRLHLKLHTLVVLPWRYLRCRRITWIGIVNPAEPDGLGRSIREFLGTFAASMGPDNYVDAGRSICPSSFQEEHPLPCYHLQFYVARRSWFFLGRGSSFECWWKNESIVVTWPMCVCVLSVLRRLINGELFRSFFWGDYIHSIAFIIFIIYFDH